MRNRCDELDEEMAFVQTRIVLLDLVELLKTRETPLPHLLDLLDLICERFPGDTNREFVKVSFPGHESRLVALMGFQLLEAAEAALGTTEQKLELVRNWATTFLLLWPQDWPVRETRLMPKSM